MALKSLLEERKKEKVLCHQKLFVLNVQIKTDESHMPFPCYQKLCNAHGARHNFLDPFAQLLETFLSPAVCFSLPLPCLVT